MSHDLRVINTYFKKAEKHKITYKSGGRKSQIDYIMCRSDEKRNIKDCKVFLGESVTSQQTFGLYTDHIQSKTKVHFKSTEDPMVEASRSRDQKKLR